MDQYWSVSREYLELVVLFFLVLGSAMMGVSWGLDRIGLFIACGLAIIGAEDVRVSIVACGLATFEIWEVVISVSWGLDRIGLFLPVGWQSLEQKM